MHAQSWVKAEVEKEKCRTVVIHTPIITLVPLKYYKLLQARLIDVCIPARDVGLNR